MHKSNSKSRAIKGLLVAFFLTPVLAFAEAIPDEYQHIREAFAEMEVTSIKPAPMDGFVEMAVGAEFFYVSDDARYVIRGDVFTVDTRENITEARRLEAQTQYISEIEDDQAIIFAADDPEYTVTVFTDIDCGYCRKLHRQMSEYNELGITVRYLFFPRSGPGSPSWFKAEEVWCAESQQEAMTMAKNSITVDSEDCGTTPVAAHFAIVNALNLNGTPTLFTEDGQRIIGYRSPEELKKILDKGGEQG